MGTRQVYVGPKYQTIITWQPKKGEGIDAVLNGQVPTCVECDVTFCELGQECEHLKLQVVGREQQVVAKLTCMLEIAWTL